MIPRTSRNLPRLQRLCACGHTEWDHYMDGACDGNGCTGCKKFQLRTENA